jgi:hypothetical protein
VTEELKWRISFDRSGSAPEAASQKRLCHSVGVSACKHNQSYLTPLRDIPSVFAHPIQIRFDFALH